MRKIFISYRRVEGEYAAGALGRELRRHFGEEQVFRDKEDIGGGQAWRRQVLLEIDRGCAMLVLIGQDWAHIKDAQGRRRLDNPEDPIRLEIADGIKDGAAVIPVLLENSHMPDAEELPLELQPMAEFNALKLRDGDWDYDLKSIFKTLERAGFKPVGASAEVVQERRVTPPPKVKTANTKAIVAAVLAFFAIAALASDDLDRDGHIGAATLAIAGLVLGVLAWRDTKDQLGWRISSIAIASLSGIAFLAALGGMDTAPSKATAQAKETSLTNASVQNTALEYNNAPPPVSESTSKLTTVQLLRGHAALHYDPAQWQVDTQNAVEAGGSQYVHHSGELYMRVIPERIQIGLETLAAVGLSNVQKIDPAAVVTRQGSQRVNDLDMAFREIDATVSGIPVTYYAYYYSDPAGSVQLVGWTGRSLMPEYRGTIEQFVSGFEVAGVKQ